MINKLTVILFLFSFLPLEAEPYFPQEKTGMCTWPVFRIQFQEDDYSGTTGNGRFLADEWIGHDTVYTIDALPHDLDYFRSHLQFIHHYWNSVSEERLSVDTSSSLFIAPATLSHTMNYYAHRDSLDYRLASMIHETVKAAVDSGNNIPLNDGIIIYHAGVGQDFDIDLDESPFDIPSFYFDEVYLSDYLPADKLDYLQIHGIYKGIVLPEYQNQLNTPIALNGTEILLTGFLLNLPALYDTDRGFSQAGIFGLMDQGSNNGSGLCPIRPSAFERIYLGWDEPICLNSPGRYQLLPGNVYQIPVTENEYFLLEYRKNAGLDTDSLYYADSTLFSFTDVLEYMKDRDLINYDINHGVLTSVSNYDLTLPASGLLIWHVDETSLSGSNPNAVDSPFLNLVEADGGDDIGKFYNTFDTRIMNGWKWDMWFEGNPGYFANNPAEYKLKWTGSTHPDTRTFQLKETGISINNFDFYSDSIVIDLNLSLDDRHLLMNGKSYTGHQFIQQPELNDIFLLAADDSSLAFFHDDFNTPQMIYHHSAPIPRNDSRLIHTDGRIYLVINGQSETDIYVLQKTGNTFSENYHVTLPRRSDLKKLALNGNRLCVIPENSNDDILIVNSFSESVSVLEPDTLSQSYTPYHTSSFYAAAGNAAILIGDSLVYSAENGGFTNGETVYANDFSFDQMIRLPSTGTGENEYAGIGQYKNRDAFALFTRDGYLMNGFPIFGDYQDIRAYRLNENLRFALYSRKGVLDIFDINGKILSSYPAPAEAMHVFMEQKDNENALLVMDATIYTLPSDSVLWAYRGRTATYDIRTDNMQRGNVFSDMPLIKDRLIYNYPNPIENGQTRFRYFATESADVEISIYYLTGRYTGVTLHQQSIAGRWNEISWNTGDLQSGVYLAKITVTGSGFTENYIIKPAILK